MGIFAELFKIPRWYVCKTIHDRYRRRRDAVLGNAWPNLYWVVVWEMTWKCNARCPYCWQEHDGYPEGEDFEKGLRNVIEANPRMLVITGGEAGLIPELEHCLRTIKEKCSNPYIVVNTNLISGDDLWDRAAGYYDGLNVSIDAPGEANRLNRGYSGDRVLHILEELHRKHPEKSICVHAVVTKASLPHIRELVEKIRSFSSRVSILFLPRLPYDHPDSVASNEETLSTFVRIVKGIQEEHEGIEFTAPNLRKPRETILRALIRKIPLRPVKPLTIACHRQFFRADVRPTGEVQHCRPFRVLPGIDREIMKHGTELHPLRMLRTYFQFLRQFHRGPQVYNPRCSSPCHCELFIEPILQATRPDRSISGCTLLAGRFRDEDIEESARFIRENINPHFREEFLEPFRRRD